jgi:hypothetical protein
MAKRYKDFRESNRDGSEFGTNYKTEVRLNEKKKNKRKQMKRRQRLKDKYDV